MPSDTIDGRDVTPKVNPEYRDYLPPLASDDREALAADIASRGVLVPIVVDEDGWILDGHHRHACCPDAPFVVMAGLSPDEKFAFISKTRRLHRNLSLEQKGVIDKQDKQVALRMAHAGMTQADIGAAFGVTQGTVAKWLASMRSIPGNTADTPKPDARAKLNKAAKVEVAERVQAGESQEQVAADFGVSQSTISRSVREVEKEREKAALKEELDSQPAPEPEVGATYDVLVIDPPWRYGARAADTTHRARNPYPDMSIDEIKALDVPGRLNENAIVWLWTTNAFMREAYDIADAWGLRVRTILTWAKDRMGTGDWLRGKTEHCLLCTRGKPLTSLTNQTTLLCGPLREHSRKPDEFYELVDALCHGTRLEMFSRQERDGWAAWGAETGKF